MRPFRPINSVQAIKTEIAARIVNVDRTNIVPARAHATLWQGGLWHLNARISSCFAISL